MLLTAILLVFIGYLVALYVRAMNRSYDYFKRHGIPGPSFRFFFGNYQDLWLAPSFSKQLRAWTNEYGSIYGLFLGTVPMYVVSNAEFLHEVYIKQFSSFQSRHLPIILRMQTGHKVHLFRATGMRWRRQRHVLNPTFSAAKLKLMSPLVSECIETMIKKLTDQQATEINIYSLYKRMTMDVICLYRSNCCWERPFDWSVVGRCAFGIDTDMQNDTNNIYLRKAAGTFEVDVDKMAIVKLTALLPWFETPFRLFYLGLVAVRRALVSVMPSLDNYIGETPGSWLINRVRDVVDLRNSTASDPVKRMDLLQLMINASTSNNIQVGKTSSQRVNHSLMNLGNTFVHRFPSRFTS